MIVSCVYACGYIFVPQPPYTVTGRVRVACPLCACLDYLIYFNRNIGLLCTLLLSWASTNALCFPPTPPSPPTLQKGSGTIVDDGGAAQGAVGSPRYLLSFNTTRTGAIARRELLMLIATSTWRRRRGENRRENAHFQTTGIC